MESKIKNSTFFSIGVSNLIMSFVFLIINISRDDKAFFVMAFSFFPIGITFLVMSFMNKEEIEKITNERNNKSKSMSKNN